MLHGAGDYEEAIAAARRSLELSPDDALAWNSIGASLSSLGRATEAIDAYRRALAINPNYYECWANLAHSQQLLLRLDEAADSYRRAIGIQYDYPQAQCAAGMLALLRGDYANGFTQFEWRWRLKVMTPRDFKEPRWQGEPLAGKTILLHAEQGAGDTLQCLRFVPQVGALGGRLVLELPQTLMRLATSLDGGGEIFAQGQKLPPFDVHCAFMSLPRVLGITLDTLPAPVSYLRADPAAVERWSRRLAGTGSGLKVGIVWAGNPKHAGDRRRSIALERLAPILDVPGVRFYSLQVGERAGDLRARLPRRQGGRSRARAHQLQRDRGGARPSRSRRRGRHLGGASRRRARPAVLGDDAVLARLALAARARGQPLVPDPAAVSPAGAGRLGSGDRAHRRRAGRTRRATPARGRTAARRRRRSMPRRCSCAPTAGRRRRRRWPGASSKPSRTMCRACACSACCATRRATIAASADLFARVAELAPDDPEAHYNLGTALMALARPAEAAGHFRRAIALAPDHAKAHGNLGSALRSLGRLTESEEACRRALALAPDSATACNNLGTALADQGRLAESIESFRQAVTLKPDFAEGYFNLGKALQRLGQRAEALAQFRRASGLRPDYAEAQLAEAFLLLVTGDFAHGLPQLEWRWRLPEKTPRNFAPPLWRGENIAGKTILLHGEQGFGDSLMLLRYAPLVAARGGRVVIEVPRALERLVARLAGGPYTVVAAGMPLPSFDLHCPLMSLPLAFGTTVETIPAAIPYFAVAPDAVARWRARFATAAGMKVGLVWAGNPIHKNDALRSIGLDRLGALLELPGLQWYSLQVGERAADLAKLPGGRITDLAAELTDFAETAAAVTALDLVIGVDTAVVHLAGALGKPVWILQPFDPDWRWLLGRVDSPWYPSARLVRQQHAGRLGRRDRQRPRGADRHRRARPPRRRSRQCAVDVRPALFRGGRADREPPRGRRGSRAARHPGRGCGAPDGAAPSRLAVPPARRECRGRQTARAHARARARQCGDRTTISAWCWPRSAATPRPRRAIAAGSRCVPPRSTATTISASCSSDRPLRRGRGVLPPRHRDLARARPSAQQSRRPAQGGGAPERGDRDAPARDPAQSRSAGGAQQPALYAQLRRDDLAAGAVRRARGVGPPATARRSRPPGRASPIRRSPGAGCASATCRAISATTRWRSSSRRCSARTTSARSRSSSTPTIRAATPPPSG